MSTILEEAAEAVDGRSHAYGTPQENWTRTAALWSAVLGVPVTAQQAVLCMVAVKLAREAHAPKRDNRVDIAGYAHVLDKLS